jgi:RimJ/RimL family protein N-acetyltransferase
MKPLTFYETSRLYLRPPTLEDAEAVFQQYAQDTEVTKYMTWRPHANIQTTREFIERCLAVWENETTFPWMIIRKDGQEVMGMIELRLKAFKTEVGYVLARAYWGQGFMPEAAKAIVEWALAQPEIYRVWAVCDVDNLASARVLEKIGMQREGLLRRHIMHPNISEAPRDCWCYAKVK